MKILDFHIHISETTGVDEVLSFLDALGMEKGALLSTDHGPQGGVWKTNVPWEAAASLAGGSHGRLYAIGSLHPDSPGKPAEALEKMLKGGVRGCKLYPHSGFYPDDPRLDEMYELAQDRGIPILIHTGIKAHPFHRMKFNHPMYIDDVAVKFPRLKIVIMHAGYPWVEEAMVISKLNERVWLDLTFLDVLQYTFSPGLVRTVIKRGMQVLGDEKMVWGSEGERLGLKAYADPGMSRIREYLNEIQELDFIRAESRDKILYENAAVLLGIEAQALS